MNKRIIYLLIVFIILIGIIIGYSFNKNLTDEPRTFKYKITQQDDEWKALKTHDEMVKASRIPSEILKKMTTEEVVDAIVEFPLLFDVLLHNSDEEGVEALLNISDAFKELTTRKDSKEALQNKLSYFSERNIPEESLYIKILKMLLTEENIIKSN